MLPPWFRAVVAAEVVGLVVLLVLLVRLAGDGVQAAGQVIAWTRPHLAQSTPLVPAPVVPSAAPAPAQPGTLAVLGGPLLSQLNRDTEATANGEMRLLARMEELMQQQIAAAMATAQRRR